MNPSLAICDRKNAKKGSFLDSDFITYKNLFKSISNTYVLYETQKSIKNKKEALPKHCGEVLMYAF